MGVPQNGCFIQENSINIDDLGYPSLWSPPYDNLIAIPWSCLQFARFPHDITMGYQLPAVHCQVMNWNILADLYATENVSKLQGCRVVYCMISTNMDRKMEEIISCFFACVFCLSHFIVFWLMCSEMLQIPDEGSAKHAMSALINHAQPTHTCLLSNEWPIEFCEFYRYVQWFIYLNLH